jgi:hypothetical protein
MITRMSVGVEFRALWDNSNRGLDEDRDESNYRA